MLDREEMVKRLRPFGQTRASYRAATYEEKRRASELAQMDTDVSSDSTDDMNDNELLLIEVETDVNDNELPEAAADVEITCPK